MKKKKFSSIVVTFIFLLQIFSSFMPIGSAKADDNAFPFVTGAALTDGSGKDISQETNVDKNSDVNVNYDFSVPEGQTAVNGTPYTVQLPDQIKLKESQADTSVKDSSGTQIGSFAVDTASNKVDITFSNDVIGVLSGKFSVSAQFDSSKIGNENPVSIDFGKNSVNVNFNQDTSSENSDETDVKKGSDASTDGTGKVDGTKDVSSLVKVDNLEIQITESDGTPIEPNQDGSYSNVPKDAKISIRYNFSLPNDSGNPDDPNYEEYDYHAGDYFNISMPEGIDFDDLNPDPFPLENDFGTLTFNGTNARVTLADYVEGKSNLSGYFNVSGTFNESITNSKEPVTIDLKYDGKAITVGFKDDTPEEPDVNIGIVKSGIYDSSSNQITWTVTVTPDAGKTVSGVSVEDIYGENQSYIDGSFTVNDIPAGSSLAVNIDNRMLTYTFPEDITGVQTIVYRTKPVDNAFDGKGTVDFTNKAVVKKDGENKGIANGKVTLNWIQKNGEAEAGNIIQWTVTVNNSNQTITNPIIKDTLPEGLKLVDGSVKFGGTTPVDRDSSDVPAAGKYSYNESTRTLTYKFAGVDGKITGKQTLTYDTEVTDPNAYLNSNGGANFTNKATLIWDEDVSYSLGTPSAGKGVGVGQGGIISKDAEGEKVYSPENNIINWTITVNNNKVNIKNAVVKDDIPAGLEYVPGSFSINDKTGENFNGTFDEGQAKAGHIEYAFGSDRTISDTYTIAFKTQITDFSKLFVNGTVKLDNSATLTGDGIKDGEQSSHGTQEFSSQVIDKSIAAGYDYTTRRVKWQIVVNKNQIPLTSAKVEDTVPAGMKFLSDTFKVTDKGGTDVTDKNKLTSTVNSDDDITDSDSFNYEFGSISDTCTITYETQLKENYLYGQFADGQDFKNTAEFSTDFGSVSDSANVNVKNPIIEKDGDYTQGSDYITWRVPINTSELNLKDVSVSDQLQEGLELDTDSVVLYKMVLGSDGQLTKGEVVPKDQYSIEYNANEDNKFTLNLGDISGAYQLEFVTDVLVDNLNVNNSITFNGGGLSSASAEKSINVRVSNAGGGGSGNTGSIDVVKVDSEDASRKLAGAKFQLYNIKQQPIADKVATTNSEGELTFGSLQFKTYYVKEIQAPKGYLLDGTLHKVRITSTDPVEYTAEDEKALGNIQLTKTGEDSDAEGLAGVEFTLFNEDGITRAVDLEGNVISPSVSDENGIVNFSNIPSGKYTIIETGKPDNYNSYDKSITADLTQITQNGQTIDIGDIKDTKIRGDIKFTKEGENSDPLKGAVFTLCQADGTTAVKDSDGKDVTAASDDSGVVTFSGVEYGIYKIKETGAPKGYNLSSQVLTADVKDNGAVVNAQPVENSSGIDPYILSDTKIRANIQFTKTGENADAAGLKEAEFALYKDSSCQNVVTDPQGMAVTSESISGGNVTFTSVEYGTYYIKETKAPEGYNLSTQVLTATIGDNDNQKTVNAQPVENSNGTDPYVLSDTKITGNIQFKKINQSGNPLKGAVFTLYRIGADGKTLTAVKDADGKDLTAASGADDVEGAAVTTGNVIFKNIEYGSYVIKETEAPSGYYLSSKVLDASITADGSTVYARPEGDTGTGVYSLSDTKIPGGGSVGIQGTISVKKTDDGGNTLSGAVFTLYNDSGNPVQTATTDAGGTAQFTKVKPGKYTVKETTAPAGYVLSTQVIPVEVNMSKVYDIGTVKDTKNAASIEVKKTDASGNPLSGAKFTLYNSGVETASAVSGQDGIARFDNVVYGSYSIKETEAPAGYDLNGKTLSVNVDSSKTYQFTVVDEKETPNPNNPGGTPNPNNPGGTPTPNNPGGTPNPNNPGGTPNPNNPGGTPNPNNPGGTPWVNSSEVLPKTGSMVDTAVLLVIGIMTVLAGILILMGSRRSRRTTK